MVSAVAWCVSPGFAVGNSAHACATPVEIFAEKWPGGAEVDMAMLFADVRGSTTLAETMDTTEYSLLIRRFFSAGANILNKSDAVLDKLMGDQVSGYYLPAFAGNNYCRKAFQSGLDLLRAVGYGSAEGPWLQIGVGVHTGRAYMGSVSTESGHNDITALGDQVNVAARLASSAAPGELVMSCVLYEAADMDLGPLERREFSVKGRQEAIPVYVLRVD